ncbi:nucleoside phosphorylase [Maribacter sp. PR1]|uniref:Uridine phosphorylase n=1 Tax=Maribacter cobaltidurans TaxID=1178778 RepID=A0ABU7IS35_9FLAO|nr:MULTISPECIES: nucleoside phosphorylase [Maribacter]MDC6388396.1 nucleoside phosphorylase [Maribacter sp. PR1]MEE1975785.1 nucleoside phosphorylase [Maribacter cobaltidurans]
MQLGPSELILNADGSIYHLNLLPKDLANTIITVGDPDRVSEVSSYFDSIEVKKGKREFLTHTGHLKGKRISVISTGIGTDNIDIVLNELDALVNIDFKTRGIKKNRIRLTIVRIGTSGAIQPDIPVNSWILSELAIGFDGLLHFYENELNEYKEMENEFMAQTQWSMKKSRPYIVGFDKDLAKKFNSNRIRLGITTTNTGFYGPQGRTLRILPSECTFIKIISDFRYRDKRITNLEMETSGIYALSKLLGHRAISLNCILANRATGEFSENPKESVQELIKFTLQKIVTK